MGAGPSFPIVRLSKDRIVLVTGANSGLGYEIAKWTAMMGATVIMACRSEARARACHVSMERMELLVLKSCLHVGYLAIDKMNTEFRLKKDKGTVGLCESESLALEFMPLELESFQSVVDFAEAFKQTQRPLHVLFCNAGLGLGPYVKTGDGFEMLLQVNYLSQFVLTAKLLPVMMRSGPDCRLLYMSSLAHKWGSFNVDTMNYTGPPRDYPIYDYYGRSKMYQIMQMYCMVRRLGDTTNVTVNSINPGPVNTRFARDMAGITGSAFGKMKRWFFTNQHNGAKCPIDCTVNPELAGVKGIYFYNCNRTRPSSVVRNEQNQEQLWKATIDYVKDYVTEEEWDILEGKKRPSNTDSSPTTDNIDNTA